jgi:pilus assembly protein CpaE
VNDARVVAVGAPQTFRQQVARTMEIEPDDIGWLPSVTAVEESLLSGREWADVVVLSPGVKDPDAIGLAEFMVRSSPTTSVVLVRDRSPNGMLPVFMRSGIRDVVDLSRGTLELREALERAMAWSANLRIVHLENSHQEKQQRGVVLSVFSSKGGTGKTFLSTNLAAAIADITKKHTAIVDLDLGMGDVFTYYGKEPEKPLSDIVSLGEKNDPDAVMATAAQLHDHLWGFGSPQDPAVEQVPGEAMGKALRAIRDTFSYTIVDASANYADHNLATFDLAHTICLISGLDVVGIRHLAKAVDTLQQVGFPRERFKIVLNFVDGKVGLEPARVERVMKIRIDSLIPASRDVPAALNRGRPVYVEDPKHDVSRRIYSLAESLIEAVKTPAEDVGGVHLNSNGNANALLRR